MGWDGMGWMNKSEDEGLVKSNNNNKLLKPLNNVLVGIYLLYSKPVNWLLVRSGQQNQQVF